MEKNWYQLSIEETLKKLEAQNTGLSSSEAAKRLDKYGPNELKIQKPSVLMRFLRQFNNPLIYVLLAAAAITGALTLRGEHLLPDTSVILGVVLLNAILGFIQEGKTEQALEALKKMAVSESIVLRDDEQKIIPARELVPGDVVLLNGGDKIPADLRLFFTKNVNVDEASLTGESASVEKEIETIHRQNLSPGDQSNMLFSGTFVTRGSARGIVVATGSSTEFGKIAKLVKETHKVQTPLQKKIAGFTKTLMIAILILGFINLLLGYLFGFRFSYSFLASVSLIVAAMPEMLPMLVTSILALASSSMSKRHALIRRLPAAETLGSVTVICSDKTGTLTKNEMTVVGIYSGGIDYQISGTGYNPLGEFSTLGKIIDPQSLPALTAALQGGLFCNNASLARREDKYRIVGDPTEGALVVMAAKAGASGKSSRLDEIPFDSEYMYMAVLVTGAANNVIYAKGSPEKILEICQHQLTDNGIEDINTKVISQKADEMAGEGLRLLAIAYKNAPQDKKDLLREDLKGMIFLGLVGMIDPPREEVIEAVRTCKTAGIRPVMITGDHVKTAKAIAYQIGIIERNEDVALSGVELARMGDRELFETVDKVSVYARVAPEHKLRIALQLQKRGQVVAMTGDGVNDAPALRAADIGISMGHTGTEVSKEASDMILTDDNFASIVSAIEEGRHAWNNLQKAILYTLPTNGGQALLIMGAILLAPFVALFALRLPLEPIQILWINLFDSVFLTLPLMMEPKEKGLLSVPPRDPKTRIANRLFFERVGLVSLIMAVIGFLIFWVFGHEALSTDEIALTQAQTAAFISVILVHLGYVMTARSIHQSAFTFSPFSNKWLLAGISVTIIANLLLVFLPALNNIFKTEPFPARWWPYVIMGLPAGFFLPELQKFIGRRLQKRKR